MADLSPEEFMARLSVKAQPLVVPDAPAPTGEEQVPGFESLGEGGDAAGMGFSILPASEAEARKLEASLASAQGARPQSVPMMKGAKPDFATKLGARPGVPFDTQSGVTFMQRLRAAAQPTKEEEQKALAAAYGEGKVRRNSFGDLVVTTTDKDGREVDKLVDPIGLDWGDAASVLGQLPEIAGAVLTATRTKGASLAPGIWNAAKTLIRMTAGAGVGGIAKDVAVRAAEGEPIQPGEIAERRTEEAGKNLAAGALLGGATKTAVTLFSPFSKVGPIQFAAKEAQEAIAAKHGVHLSLSPAEATGNTFLQRTEALESQKPGASVAFEKLWKEREEQVSKLQKIVLGGAAPDEEEAGRRALEALGAKTAPLTQNIEKAAAEAATAAENELKAGVGTAVDKRVVGEAIDTGAKALREQFDKVNAANYDAFYGNPLARKAVIEGKGLKGEIDAMLRDLPKVKKQVEVPSVDAYGSPTVRTVTRNVPIDTPVRPRLEELSSKLAGGKVSINDLKQIRTDVDNAIKTGEAVPGVKEGRLKHLYSALTDSIEQGLDDIGDPALTKAWRTAADYYKANVGKFEKAGIAELFRDPINAMGPHELVDRALTSPDTYAAYKEFFGAASPQMRGVQQAIRDETLGLSDLSPTVGASAFVKRLEALPKEVRTDVFGANAGKLRAAAQALRSAGGESLPASELQEMLRSGNLSAAKVEQMVTFQRGRDEAYRNELVRAASEGNLKPDSIKPTEFVNRLVFNAKTQPRDLSEITALLSDRPDVLEDVRRLTFQRALDDATVVNKQTGRRVIAADSLEELLGNENSAKRLKTVLGASTFEDLANLKDFLKAGSMIQQAAKGAGAFGASAQTAAIVERGALKYVDRALRNFVLAEVYTSPTLRAYFANTVLSGESKAALVNYAVASAPFLKAVLTIPKEGAQRQAMYAIKGSIDRYLQENPAEARMEPAKAAGGAGEIPWNEFLQRLNSAKAAQP